MAVQYKACKCGAKIPRNLSKCDKCEASRQKQYDTTSRNQDSKAFYQSKEWKAVRLIVLQSNPFCSCGSPAVIVDHIKELRDGGEALSLDNLVGMCVACHNRKTADERKKRGE